MRRLSLIFFSSHHPRTNTPKSQTAGLFFRLFLANCTMRSLLSLCLLFLAAAVHAVSVAGGRLLAIMDDVAEKETYSKFLGDLEGELPLLLMRA